MGLSIQSIVVFCAYGTAGTENMHSVKRAWSPRSFYTPGEQNVLSDSLVDPKNVLPPLHYYITLLHKVRSYEKLCKSHVQREASFLKTYATT